MIRERGGRKQRTFLKLVPEDLRSGSEGIYRWHGADFEARGFKQTKKKNEEGKLLPYHLTASRKEKGGAPPKCSQSGKRRCGIIILPRQNPEKKPYRPEQEKRAHHPFEEQERDPGPTKGFSRERT